MNNPFSKNYCEDEDFILIEKALGGSEESLVELITKHQNFIYNIVFKMVTSPYDAEDVTQEIIIKIITKLDRFKGKSSFRTWLYRIVVNHTLTMKKKWLEERCASFSIYENDLDLIDNQSMSAFEEIEMRDMIEEVRLGCMAGMLLCLSREQRMTFILGEIFEIPHDLGAEFLDISKDNFRQRLSRARHDLYQFMNKKCGLVNKENPCRCMKKTKGFIAAGMVDPQAMKFNTAFTKRIYEVITDKDRDLKKIEEMTYQNLLQDHPFQEKDFVKDLMKKVIEDGKTLRIFDLEP
jgi:RNA polymerase sigma factor (sigma-70 family)